MALSDEERRERARLSQYKYNQSEKGKARNKRYEQSVNSKAYRKKYREKNNDYFIDYQEKYRETEAYNESIKKYRESDKYKENERKKKERPFLLYTELNEDGRNNDIPKNKIKEKKTMVEFTDKFIDDFCETWIEWLEDSTFVNEEGIVKFRKEVFRINYSQFVTFYKRKTGTRVSLTQIEKEYLNNEYFRERMAEIDMIYEQNIESLMAQGLVNAISSKFILTNRFKHHWEDSKSLKTETTMNQMVNFSESLYQMPKKNEPKPQQLDKHIDYDDFEEIDCFTEDDKNE